MRAGDARIAALRRFAAGITGLTVVGHLFLGFEPSWAQVGVAVATAYALELTLELVDTRARRRPSRLRGGPVALVDFLLPAHISGLAIALLLYPNDELAPMAFAAAVAIGSKWLVRVPVDGRSRHVFNPSNLGIAATLALFPRTSVVPPYHFTEEVAGAGDWLVPAFILATGTFLNARFTRKIPLILGWLGAFAVQGTVRSLVAGTPVAASLVPMTGVAFLLFTFYMVTDPATTPARPARQVAFGAGVAGAYAGLMAAHVVFGLFFALVAVCAVRGVALALVGARRARGAVAAPATAPAPAGAVAPRR